MTLVERAGDYFEQLLALDPHRAERQEAIEAGVGLNHIAALYGFEFESLVPGLCAHFDQVGFLDINQKRDWDKANEYLHTLRTYLGAKPRAELEADISIAVQRKNGVEALREHIETVFAGFETGREALLMARTLWFAHWYMSRLPKLTREDQRLACELMTWAHVNILNRKP